MGIEGPRSWGDEDMMGSLGVRGSKLEEKPPH